MTLELFWTKNNKEPKKFKKHRNNFAKSVINIIKNILHNIQKNNDNKHRNQSNRRIAISFNNINRTSVTNVD